MLVENRQFEPTPTVWRPLWSPWAIVWRCLRDPAFSRFGTVAAFDGQTDGHTTTARTGLWPWFT